MFSQWLFIICTLLFVGAKDTPDSSTANRLAEDVCEVSKVVRADTQYGWQVSGSSVSSYDVPAN